MARLPRTGFLQNLNGSESGTLMVYFQGLRLNYGAMQSNPDALQRAVFAGHKRDPVVGLSEAISALGIDFVRNEQPGTNNHART